MDISQPRGSISADVVDELHRISDALESVVWICQGLTMSAEPGSNRTAESVHSLLSPWDSRLSDVIEDLEELAEPAPGGAGAQRAGGRPQDGVNLEHAGRNREAVSSTIESGLLVEDLKRVSRPPWENLSPMGDIWRPSREAPPVCRQGATGVSPHGLGGGRLSGR